MQFFVGPVSIVELIILTVVSFFAFAFGYSLPLMASLSLIVWPLFLIQLIMLVAILGLIRLYKGAGTERDESAVTTQEKRHGPARFVRMVPLAALSVGFVKQYIDTGTWWL